MAKSLKQANAQANKAGILTSKVAMAKGKSKPAVDPDEELLEEEAILEEVAAGESEEVAEPVAATATKKVKGVPAPAAKTPAPPFKVLGELDEYGFGSKTQSSFLLAHLEEGTYTKAQILESFVNHFRMDADGKVSSDPNAALDTARKKSSASVFFSDVVKPFGTYHASRSLIITTDDATKVMTLEPKRAALVKKAIAAGILQSLKGFNMKKHEDKVKLVLKKYGIPVT